MVRHRFIACALVVLTGLAAAGAAPAKEPELLSRSIYIPVIFSVPPEIASELWIWIGEEEKPRRPLRHTFLFTFFPDKGDRFVPERVEVRIRAAAVCEGSGIDTNLFISPWGITTGEKSVAFDQKEIEKQVRARHRDVRVKPKVIHIRCQAGDGTESVVSGPQNQ